VAADGSVESNGLYWYAITAKGKLASSDYDDSGEPSYTGLNVTCSWTKRHLQLPSWRAPEVRPLKSGKIIVCKQSAAALELVFDKEAVTTLKRESNVAPNVAERNRMLGRLVKKKRWRYTKLKRRNTRRTCASRMWNRCSRQ
jgi:hypothetical protein